MQAPTPPRELFIFGITDDGRAFRPSDWAERLAGAMACFRPGGAAGGPDAFIGYSPYCVPTIVDGVKCVVVNEAVREVEPMAWDFVMNFARDNGLRVVEACLLPEAPAEPSPRLALQGEPAVEASESPQGLSLVHSSPRPPPASGRG